MPPKNKKKKEEKTILVNDGVLVTYPLEVGVFRCGGDGNRMGLYQQGGRQWLQCPLCNVEYTLYPEVVKLVEE